MANQSFLTRCVSFLNFIGAIFLVCGCTCLLCGEMLKVTETLTARCAARLSDSKSDIVMDHFKSTMESVFTKLEELTEEQGLPDQDKEYIYQVFKIMKYFHTHFY